MSLTVPAETGITTVQIHDDSGRCKVKLRDAGYDAPTSQEANHHKVIDDLLSVGLEIRIRRVNDRVIIRVY